MDAKVLKRGTQIAYVPQHVWDEMKPIPWMLEHPHTEFGFVTSVHPDGEHVYCRYWLKDHPDEIRNKSCGEHTPVRLLLMAHGHKPQDEVDKLAKKLSLKYESQTLSSLQKMVRGIE